MRQLLNEVASHPEESSNSKLLLSTIGKRKGALLDVPNFWVENRLGSIHIVDKKECKEVPIYNPTKVGDLLGAVIKVTAKEIGIHRVKQLSKELGRSKLSALRYNE